MSRLSAWGLTRSRTTSGLWRTTGIAHPGGLGLGWEVLDGWHGDYPIHLLSTGGRTLSAIRSWGKSPYGLERLALYLQGASDFKELVWTDAGGRVTYADVYHQYEVEMSAFNFDLADVEELFRQFDFCEKEAARILAEGKPLPAYEYVLKASHCSICWMRVTRFPSRSGSDSS